MTYRLNCWEYFECGREPGGKNAETEDICPVTVKTEFNNSNQGKNAGRCCWAVSKNESDLGTQFSTCLSCPFFAAVQYEESRFFELNLTTKEFYACGRA